MKIIVCVKQILDPRGLVVNRKAEKVFVNREEYILDPASRAALQAATAVKDAVIVSGGSATPEIVAISLGPDRADDALREAMALGADRAIHLKDAAFDNADARVVANALAAAISQIGALDLILIGARSLDSGSGELAPRLAEALDLPVLIDAVLLEMKGSAIDVVRQCGDYFVRVQANLPVVVSVNPVGDWSRLPHGPLRSASEVSESRLSQYPNGWRLMDAYRKWTVEVWSAADLGLSEDDLRPMAVRKDDAFPPERQPGTKVKDAQELVAMLKRDRMI